MSDPSTVADYIRRAAESRGIDPEVALRVFKQESGFNPAARNVTDREESYGVAQLNVKGGLGVTARQQGIEPSDPAQWPRHVDFALDTVKKDGWRQWYGARDVGIGRWDGIGGQPAAPSSTTTPAPAPFSPPPAADSSPRAPVDIADIFQHAAFSPVQPASGTKPAGPLMGDGTVDNYLADQSQQRLFQPRTTQSIKPKTRHA